MKSLILYPLLISFIFSQKIDLNALELARRGNDYRVWIYFKDKAGSEKINATQEAHQRRLKHGSRIDYNWYDLKIDSDFVERSEDVIYFYNNFLTPCELDGYFNCPTWSLRIDETRCD